MHHYSGVYILLRVFTHYYHESIVTVECGARVLNVVYGIRVVAIEYGARVLAVNCGV